MRRSTLIAALVLLVVGSRTALAFEVISVADVKDLAGKTVWIEVPCSAAVQKPYKEIHIFVGQEVTILGPGTPAVWAKVKDSAGNVLDLQIDYLSKAKPAYSQLATGKLEAFLPGVFAEAYDIPAKLADLLKSHDYDFGKDLPARAAYDAYEQAFNYHKHLLGHLVNGREGRVTILGDESKKWLWTADPSVMEAYSEGMTYVKTYEKSDFLRKAETARDLAGSEWTLAESASNIMVAKHELGQKSWLSGLKKDVPQAQKDALDKDETDKRTKRIAELEERIVKTREQNDVNRKKLGY